MWTLCVFQISKESEDFIVEQYKRLRQRDGSGVTKSAWRITVRQLESMIRLSESMARMHCCDEVSMSQTILYIYIIVVHFNP